MKNKLSGFNGYQLITITQRSASPWLIVTIVLILSLTSLGWTSLIVKNEGEFKLCFKDSCLYIGKLSDKQNN